MGEELLALGVAAVGKLEAGFVDRVHGVVDRAVGIVASVVSGAAVARDNLDILIAVIALLFGKADGGYNLVV